MSVEGLRRPRAPRGSGDRLRDEILDAATELLPETGRARGVSICSVARRVGVTPPSIYLHFADKEALLDAVCARHFDKLDADMRRAAEHPCPVEALRAQGLAYFRFAARTPELYRTATMREWLFAGDVDATLEASVLQHLRATALRLMDDGILSAGDPTRVALQLWSAVHGVAAMVIAKPHLPFGDAEAFADRILCSVFCGQVVIGYCDTDATPQKLAAWVAAHRQSEDPWR